MLDTVPYIIQNNFPEKSFTEIYAPYIASGITAIITLLVLVFTLRSTRKRMREDNLMKLRKEWIQEFSKLCAEIYKLMKDDSKKPYNIHNLLYIQERKEIDTIRHEKLTECRDELEYKIRVDGSELFLLFSNVSGYLDGLKEDIESNYTANNREELKIERVRFKIDSSKIIREETQLLNINNNDSIIQKILNLRLFVKIRKKIRGRKVIVPKN